MERRYRVFFDESGDDSYQKKNGATDNHSNRYLAICGCIFLLPDHYEVGFAQGVDAFRERYFGQREERDEPPVILHREDIVHRRGPFVILSDEIKKASFDADLLLLITNSEYRIITIVVDKWKFFAKYGRRANPYAYCLWNLLDVYCEFLASTGFHGDVMGEARKGHLDEEIKDTYNAYYEEHQGAGLTTKEIKLRPKDADIPGIQLADLLAYPTKQDILSRQLPLGHRFFHAKGTRRDCTKIPSSGSCVFELKKTGVEDPGFSAVRSDRHTLQVDSFKMD